MRLTAELINASPQFVNPLKDRELDLRGNGITAIENLGVTQDQFDAIDLSDNEIHIVENFPLLKRLRTLILNNNKIVKIASKLNEVLPQLRDLILTNNQIRELSDLVPLFDLSATLECLSLMDNPVALRHDDTRYRLYLIAHLPKLRMLDFRKVKLKERQEAEKLFAQQIAERKQKLRDEATRLRQQMRKNKKQQLQLTTTPAAAAAAASSTKEAAKTFVPGEIPPPTTSSAANATETQKQELTPEQKQKIKDAILRATTMEEVARLESFLKRGRLPKELRDPNATANGTQDSMDVE